MLAKVVMEFEPIKGRSSPEDPEEGVCETLSNLLYIGELVFSSELLWQPELLTDK